MQIDMAIVNPKVVANCDHLRTQSGSIALECALALPVMVAVMMMVLHIGLLCIRKQNVIYDTFMEMRAQMIAADVARAVQLTHGDNPVCDGCGAC